MAPRWAQDGPKRPQEVPSCFQDGPKMAPRWPQEAPRGSRRLQDGPVMAARGPKVSPKNIKNTLRNACFRFSSVSRFQDGFKMTQEPPRWPQEAASGSMIAPRRPISGFDTDRGQEKGLSAFRFRLASPAHGPVQERFGGLFVVNWFYILQTTAI